MLMNSIRKSYRNFINPTGSVTPIVAARGIRKAANSSSYGQTETQARRQRRASRLVGLGHHSNIGWRVSAW